MTTQTYRPTTRHHAYCHFEQGSKPCLVTTEHRGFFVGSCMLSCVALAAEWARFLKPTSEFLIMISKIWACIAIFLFKNLSLVTLLCSSLTLSFFPTLYPWAWPCFSKKSGAFWVVFWNQSRPAEFQKINLSLIVFKNLSPGNRGSYFTTRRNIWVSLPSGPRYVLLSESIIWWLS